jgi:hypothetical protein
MNTRALAFAGGIALTIVALSTGAPAGSGSSEEIVVTRDTVSLPSGCSPRQVAELIARFFAAFNEGDARMLDGLFEARTVPTGEPFRWYSVTESGVRHRVVFDRRALLGYFAERHRHRERLRLLNVDMPGTFARLGIGVVLIREADDLVPGLGGRFRIAEAKGSIDCRRQRIHVWSMGMDMAPEHDLPPNVSWSCPRPAGWEPGRPILTCSRGGRSPNAQEVTTPLLVRGSGVGLPKRCRLGSVRDRLLRLVRAFNIGAGDAAAAQFIRRGNLHPYTASITGYGFLGRGAIARFVGARYRLGDGWGIGSIGSPQGSVGLPAETVYGVGIRVTSRSRPHGEGGTKLVVDCRSGLFRRWVGPALELPA